MSFLKRIFGGSWYGTPPPSVVAALKTAQQPTTVFRIFQPPTAAMTFESWARANGMPANDESREIFATFES
jgi:hypothetical protein